MDFNIKTNCIYCGKYINTEKQIKQNVCEHEHDYIHKVEISETLSSIIAKALEWNDTWGKEVRIRVPNVGGLGATEIIYFH